MDILDPEMNLTSDDDEADDATLDDEEKYSQSEPTPDPQGQEDAASEPTAE